MVKLSFWVDLTELTPELGVISRPARARIVGLSGAGRRDAYLPRLVFVTCITVRKVTDSRPLHVMITFLVYLKVH